MTTSFPTDQPNSAYARCPFEVETFEPSAWGPAEQAEMQLGRASLRKRFSGGDLDAVGTVEMLSARHGEDAGTYVAIELIEGTLGDREGTFVLQHGGTAAAGEEQHTWVEVVAGSGTGDLEGLRGSGRIEHGLLELHYDVDPHAG